MTRIPLKTGGELSKASNKYKMKATKSFKQLHIIVCFNVLSISSAFTISTYFINAGALMEFQEKDDIGYMYNQ